MLAFRTKLDPTTGATVAEPYCAECRSHPTLEYHRLARFKVDDTIHYSDIYRCPNCERWTQAAPEGGFVITLD
jgi:hypothetical protein